MVVQTAGQATSNARGYTSCVPGLCLGYTRRWLEIDSRDNWAITAFRNAERKHPGDRTPPRGAPVFWSGGSHGYGHIALALMPFNGKARIRSTDIPSSGRVSTVELDYVEQHWGMHYEGWTEDLNGVLIPYFSETEPETSDWSTGDVYVSRLHAVSVDSDSVRRMQYRLKNLQHGGTPTQPITGSYLQRTVASVKHWQETIGGSGPKDGRSVDASQAHQLFGDNYTIHD